MVALAALALAAPLAAALPPPAPPVSAKTVPRIFLADDGVTIYIVGPIMDDAFLRFDAVLQAAPRVRQVYLA